MLPRDAGTLVVDGHAVPAGASSAARSSTCPTRSRRGRRRRSAGRSTSSSGSSAATAGARPTVVERLDARAAPRRAASATLSKGQRKRALLALGLLTPHPLLLADEPFDGLDLRQTRDVGAALREHAAAGRTLFLSIHQITDAARVCDRFVLLSGGRVRGEGTLDELAGAAAGASRPAPVGRRRSKRSFLALT